MTKKRKASRTNATRDLPKTTKLQQARAAKMAAPFLDQMQRAVDEQTQRDFGLKPQSKQQAEAFRKRVTGLVADDERRKK